MTATQRRERDRRHRHELIVRTARDMAEAEGWDAVTTRRLAAAPPDVAIRAVARAYLDFAAAHPALYEAMFSLPIDVRFASPGQTPQPLQDSFTQLVAVLGPTPLAPEAGEPFGATETALLAEVYWSALHGLATLTRRGRLPASGHQARLDLLLALLTKTGPAPY